ncbi:MAG: hypothetical protein K9G48_13860 [Reyranella sp.]|nr:hypothetical protein [Reyranella sp.]
MRPQALRPRRIYWRPTEGYVGFGRNVPEQPDLMESEYRFGWRIVVVCRVCLLAERHRLQQANVALQAEVERITALARAASVRIGQGVGIIDKRIDGSRGDQ